MKFKGEVEITFPEPAIHHLEEFEAKDEWDAQSKALRKLKKLCKDSRPMETRLLLFMVVEEVEHDEVEGQLALF